MSPKMLKFVSTEKAMPEKRAARNRIADFDEIYEEFQNSDAETQASRCSQCGVPFCQVNIFVYYRVALGALLLIGLDQGWLEPIIS